MYLILAGALDLWLTHSNRNTRNGIKLGFWGVEHGCCVKLATSPQSVDRFSRQYGITNMPQPHRPPRPVTEMALLFYFLHCIYLAHMNLAVSSDYFQKQHNGLMFSVRYGLSRYVLCR
jgi:hypothetical protein